MAPLWNTWPAALYQQPQLSVVPATRDPRCMNPDADRWQSSEPGVTSQVYKEDSIEHITSGSRCPPFLVFYHIGRINDDFQIKHTQDWKSTGNGVQLTNP